MKECIDILWRNGLGNQLFQYTYGKILAKKHNIDLTYSGIGRGCTVSLLEYGLIKEPKDIIKKSSNHSTKTYIDYNRQQGVELENPHFYKKYITEIKNFFPKIEKTNTKDLVVHLRLGDNGPNIHTPFEWYKKAIEDNNIEFENLYLITDGSNSEDAIKFKKHYNAIIPSLVDVKTQSDWAGYIDETIYDFNFIRKFDKILFSNSTFSWWASVLSNASEIYFNNEWQPNHHNGIIKLGQTDYNNFRGICPFSLKD